MALEFRQPLGYSEARRGEAYVAGSRSGKWVERLSLAEPASSLYDLFSRYGVHGGTPDQLLLTPLVPTKFSCSFQNRPETRLADEFDLVARGCEVLCVEIADLGGLFGTRTQATSEGGAAILVWLSKKGERDRIAEVLLKQIQASEAE
jgi:hypothetical protein